MWVNRTYESPQRAITNHVRQESKSTTEDGATQDDSLTTSRANLHGSGTHSSLEKTSNNCLSMEEGHPSYASLARRRHCGTSGLGRIAPCSESSKSDSRKAKSTSCNEGPSFQQQTSSFAWISDVFHRVSSVVEAGLAQMPSNLTGFWGGTSHAHRNQEVMRQNRKQSVRREDICELQGVQRTLGSQIDRAEAKCVDFEKENDSLRQIEAMREQERMQMEELLREKAKLVAENSRLARELKGMQELLDYTTECFSEDDGERGNGSDKSELVG
ncbi:hypothetical protein BSKO_03893 [Bryopsis sp. KO-2023]|nr:hypothetical protein BSKO_03893 [Bryopsis sp. KO-2023]